ncbi:MAG TPA: arylesterase [Zoogloea sp.]|uniref:arylesterase n=1 Tax=Zoogloea sp. TaxID=49181 RepID=UPI002CA3E950|nr:arylesterase [Zoogloea sp.]HMV16678.1 arylesterase [Rhodocyclaceae bacterium]HMV62889.1 arylesterase [Rhodocyclaceae bacterium]HMW50493.1 arylesterase [Rhodocyclaceae bacterium]HMY48014.1 arylesterase [Rhodocyclaceae bacterium]HMZ74561.1 arylesterase [Rhodocyclaceae bacterium]
MRAAALLRRAALAVLLLTAGAPAFAGKILVWGDSLSAGYGLRPQEAWPDLLGQRLAGEKSAWTVVNGSISGETTAGGRARLPAALDRQRPAVVIIELGANDGLRGLPVPAMVANLQAMIDAARKAGAQVLLVGMRMPPNFGPDFTARYEKAFRDLARTNTLRFVPFLMDGFADQPAFFQPDGLHPVASAQPRILETVWKELKPLLH